MSGAFPISTANFETMGIKSLQDTIISKSLSGKKLSRQIDNQRFGFTASIIVGKRSNIYGDFVKFASHNKVYMVVADATADGSNEATITIEPPLRTALVDDSVVTYDNVPFTVHLTNDIQEFGVVGADGSGNLLYKFEIDVEETV